VTTGEILEVERAFRLAGTGPGDLLHYHQTMREANLNPVRCLITAGPTREYLDPVRFMTNASSGKMGYALAEKAVAIGWEVDLLSGPVALEPVQGVRIHSVVSAEDMLTAAGPLFQACDVIFMVAAVSDYRPVHRAVQKMKKTASRMTVDLIRTTDILSTLAAGKNRQVVVGFAAETDNLEGYARKKLTDKGLDWIVANDISRPEVGMEVDDNRVILLSAAGARLPFGPAPKPEVAGFILEQVRPSVESVRMTVEQNR